MQDLKKIASKLSVNRDIKIRIPVGLIIWELRFSASAVWGFEAIQDLWMPGG